MFKKKTFENDVIQFLMARRFLGKDLYFAACYYVDGLLIDSGSHHLQQSLFDALKNLPIDMIVNTHAHEDHIGCNSLLQKNRSIPILAHSKAIPIIADPLLLSLRPYQKIFFGQPQPSKADIIPDVITTKTKEYNLQTLNTPGHSPDHIALFEENKGWLFSGDAVIGGKEQMLRVDYDICGMLESYRYLAEFPINILFTGSGGVIHDPISKIKTKIDYLEETGKRVRELHEKGVEANDISTQLFKSDKINRFLTSGHFSSTFLTQSFLNGIENNRL